MLLDKSNQEVDRLVQLETKVKSQKVAPMESLEYEETIVKLNGDIVDKDREIAAKEKENEKLRKDIVMTKNENLSLAEVNKQLDEDYKKAYLEKEQIDEIASLFQKRPSKDLYH